MRNMTETPLTDIAADHLDGQPTTLGELADGAALVVNVASKCGLTPQYTALEQLAKDYGDRGLTVIGVPCNQFMGQEPGTAEEIQTFCSTTYGVDVPAAGQDRRQRRRPPPAVRRTDRSPPDGGGEAGDIQWNFEKFLLAPGGKVVNRFRPRTVPDAPEVIAAIEGFCRDRWSTGVHVL